MLLQTDTAVQKQHAPPHTCDAAAAAQVRCLQQDVLQQVVLHHQPHGQVARQHLAPLLTQQQQPGIVKAAHQEQQLHTANSSNQQHSQAA
jgi:hypothetical protein